MIRQHSAKAARDPETPPWQLYHLAYFYPREVLENPVLPMVALEDPELWQRIVGRARLYKAKLAFDVELERLHWGSRLRVVIKAGERLLPILFAEDRVDVERCLQTLRAQLKARGNLKRETLEQAKLVAARTSAQSFFVNALDGNLAGALAAAEAIQAWREEQDSAPYWLAMAKEVVTQLADIREEAAR